MTWTKIQNIFSIKAKIIFLVLIFLAFFGAAGEAEATIIFDGTFKQSDHWVNKYTYHWGGQDYYSCVVSADRIQIKNNVGGRPEYVAHFYSYAGEICNSPTAPRNYLGAHINGVSENVIQYYSFSIFLPSDFSSIVWIQPWEIQTTAPPEEAVSFKLKIDSSDQLAYGYGTNAYGGGTQKHIKLPTTSASMKNKWTDFVLGIKWSSTNNGFVDVYQDGKLISSVYNVQTYNGINRPELEVGIYSGLTTGSLNYYIGNIKIGTTYNDVKYNGAPPTLDTEDPAVDITCPGDNSTFTSPVTSVSGTATDNQGVKEVWVKVGPSGAWQPTVLASPNSPSTGWSITNLTGIVSGLNTIYAKVVDTSNNDNIPSGGESGEFIKVTLSAGGATPPMAPSETCTKTVAKDGSGNYTTIQAAADVAVAGDTVCVKAGTYNEYVQVKNSGTQGNPITFKADPGVIVQYSGSSMPQYSGIFWILNKNYIIIDGFKTIGGYTGIVTAMSVGTIIRNNYVQDPLYNGIGVSYSSYVLVTGNVVDRGSNAAYHEGIDVFNDSHDIEISNNHVVRNVLGEAFVIKDGSRNIKVHHNTAEYSKEGFWIDGYQVGIDNVELYNNIAINNTLDGGMFAVSEQGGIVQNINFHDNFASNNKLGMGVSTYGFPGSLKNIQFSNNIANGNGQNYANLNLASVNVNNIVSPNYSADWGYHAGFSGGSSSAPPSCTAPATTTTPEPCGNSVKDPGEFCEKATNEGCSPSSSCNESCSACTPVVVCSPKEGQECKPANSCGETSTGVYQCNGSCSVPPPPLDPGVNVPCTSQANACGLTSSALTKCDKSCPADTPALPYNFGKPCQSAENFCNLSSPGTVGCQGCSAETPDLPAALNDNNSCTTDTCDKSGNVFHTNTCGGLVPCGRNGDNPATADIDESKPCSLCALFYMLKNIVNYILSLSSIIGSFILIVSGLFYASSAGDTGKITLAKQAATTTVAGLIIIFIAWLAVAAILQALGYAGIGTWNQVNCG